MKINYFILLFFVFFNSVTNSSSGIRLKEIGRFSGVIEHELIGYGLVVGLARTGDSARNRATIQSIANTLTDFELRIDENDISSRNVAAVIISAKLPPFYEKGDRIDVKVSSMGDARSLAGGLLVLSPLKAPNGDVLAIAQGQITVGGYAFDSFDSVVQKNHPTVGIVSGGGLVSASDNSSIVSENGVLKYVLNEPDFDSIHQITSEISRVFPTWELYSPNSGKIEIKVGNSFSNRALINAISKIENIKIQPDIKAKIVINERTGSIVSGGDVRISSVTISHGSLKLEIDTKYNASQPFFVGKSNDNIETLVLPETNIRVNENIASAVDIKERATVSDLVRALQSLNVTTRDIIVILQSIKKAGALHAELIVE